MNEPTKTTTEFVFRRLQEPVSIFGQDLDPRWWLGILGLVLYIGCLYIGWMYGKDSRGVGNDGPQKQSPWFPLQIALMVLLIPVWLPMTLILMLAAPVPVMRMVKRAVGYGIFLPLLLSSLRAWVYAILALMFLLPARQTWHDTKQESKVIVMFDISDSVTETKDDLPQPGQTLADVDVRQQKVFNFLQKGKFSFFNQIAKTNPMDVLRFSRSPDLELRHVEESIYWPRELWEKRQSQIAKGARSEELEKGLPLDKKDWESWLFPRTAAQVEEKWAVEEADAQLRAKVSREEQLRRSLIRRNAKLVDGGSLRGTAVAESLLGVLKKEVNNLVQGIVVVTDGKSTEGSTQSFLDVANIASRADIPIFVVAVGKDRPKVSIEIADLRVPPQVRPEDKFRVVASVNGPGMQDETFPIYLDVTRVVKNDKGEVEEKDLVLVGLSKDGDILPDAKVNLGKKVTLDKRFLKQKTTDGRQDVTNPPKFLKGNPPNAQVEFEINAQVLADAAGKPVSAGKWGINPDPNSELRFRLRIPRDKREIIAKKEHVSNPADMRVLKKPLRILLFASVASREYRFVRSLMTREMDKNRAEVCIYLQPLPGQTQRGGIVQDVPAERLLDEFPTRRKLDQGAKGENRFKSLDSYDVIIAFDPDWLQLTPNQRKILFEWVEKDGGGLIVIGNKLNMLELSRPTLVKSGTVDDVLNLLPVVVDFDKLSEAIDATKPYRLKFGTVDTAWEFLRLEEDNPKIDTMEAWNRFHNEYENDAGEKAMIAPDAPPERGYYGCVPVKSVKENAVVVARLPHPDLTIVDPRDRQRKDQPYFVIGNNGQGKVVWLGSGEMWRLRMYKESFHERFWTKLARYVGSGSLSTITKTITPVMSRYGVVNKPTTFEARFEGFDGKPLPRKTEDKPNLYITLPAGTPPRKGDRVSFNGKTGIVTKMMIKDDKPWVQVKIKDQENLETIEASKVDVSVPNLVLKPRLGEEGPAGGVDENEGWFKVEYTPPAPGEYKMELKNEQTGEVYTHTFIVKDSNPELDDVRPDVARLYALASSAENILSRIDNEQDRTKARMALRPPRREGRKPDGEKEPTEVIPQDEMRLYFNLNNADLVPLFMEKRVEQYRNKGKIDDLWDEGFELPLESEGKPITLSWALILVVGLLSLEWLIRKLIRLA